MNTMNTMNTEDFEFYGNNLNAPTNLKSEIIHNAFKQFLKPTYKLYIEDAIEDSRQESLTQWLLDYIEERKTEISDRTQESIEEGITGDYSEQYESDLCLNNNRFVPSPLTGTQRSSYSWQDIEDLEIDIWEYVDYRLESYHKSSQRQVLASIGPIGELTDYITRDRDSAFFHYYDSLSPENQTEVNYDFDKYCNEEGIIYIDMSSNFGVAYLDDKELTSAIILKENENDN